METTIKIQEYDAILTINPAVYPLEAVYAAAYVHLNDNYILLDGDPKEGITIRIEPKTKGKDMEKIAKDFANELITYADYRERSAETKEIRELLLQRALFTNDPKAFRQEEGFDEEEFERLMKELDKEALDDPEGIAIPWEEKYGKKDSPQQ